MPIRVSPILAAARSSPGMLRPAHWLDIIRHFTLYRQVSGRAVKIVCRYQPFRAVQYAVDRLLYGQHDRRGGIVWPTQGSGKNLTMVFLVRKMRSSRGGSMLWLEARAGQQKPEWAIENSNL